MIPERLGQGRRTAGQEAEAEVVLASGTFWTSERVINQKVWVKGHLALRISKKKVKTACSGSEHLGACGCLWFLLSRQAGKAWQGAWEKPGKAWKMKTASSQEGFCGDLLGQHELFCNGERIRDQKGRGGERKGRVWSSFHASFGKQVCGVLLLLFLWS